MGRLLGAGIASFVNIFSPEVVVLGGGFGIGAVELLLGPALEVARREALPPAGERLRIVCAELGEEAGPDRRGAARRRADLRNQCWPSAPRRSATSTTSRCASWPSCAKRTSCSVRTRRHTRGLLQRHGIDARLVSYHQHNEAARVAELLPRLEAGERIALVSDAGLPGLNDPGARLIAAALERGVAVTVLPGASAIETALVASGLAGERYQFLGYLPRRRRSARRSGASSPPGSIPPSRSSRHDGCRRRCGRSPPSIRFVRSPSAGS